MAILDYTFRLRAGYRTVSLLMAMLPFTGWGTTPADEREAEALRSRATESVAVPRRGQGGNLYEERLLRIVESSQALESYAAQPSRRDGLEIQRRFREVASAFQSLIADNPEQIEARLIYGKFLDYFGDHDGARDQFMEVLRRDPTVAVAHQQLGTYFAEHGDLGRALAYYLAATDHAPKEPFYHFGLGELLAVYRVEILRESELSVAGLERQMLRAFHQAMELAPADPVYGFRYGEALMNIEEPDWEAVLAHWTAFGERRELSPVQSATIQLHRAQSLGELGRYREARQLVQSVELVEVRDMREALLVSLNEAENARVNQPGNGSAQ